MKKILGYLICAILLAFGAQAHALSLTPSSTPQWSGPETSQSDIDPIILGLTGYDAELYKQDVGGGESGILAGSYNTEFLNTASDPSGATNTYAGSGPIVDSPAYLLVKDGNQNPAWYLFGLTALGWDGMETLSLDGFWPRCGAISHVSLYGKTTSVPEPATLLLLGTGLVGFAGTRIRKRFKK